MGESTKAVLALLGIIAACASLAGWLDDRPDGATWLWRIVPLLVAAGIFGLLLKLHFRRDRAPDFLAERCDGTYFNRGGFAFGVSAARIEDERTGAPIGALVIPFQNQTDAPCRAQVSVRPGRGFLLGRGGMDRATVKIACPAAAFGEAVVPIAVPAELAGKRRKFEVGATVDWPKGRGRQVRYGDGVHLRQNAEFQDVAGCLLQGAALLSGSLLWSRPPTAEFALPKRVSASPPRDQEPTVQILWNKWGKRSGARPAKRSQ